MLISNEKENASFPSEDEIVSSKPSPVEPMPDALDGLQIGSEFPGYPPVEVATLSNDVKVVPDNDKHELEQAIVNLEEEISQLGLKQKSLDEKRREVLNKILNIKGSIRVLCRVRPFLPSNKRRIYEPISAGPEKIVVKSGGVKKEFGFDMVFPPEARQDDIFSEVKPVLKTALGGGNVCVIAYGQTGTGKTFTMDGTNDHPGIVPRALEVLFHEVSLHTSATFTFSMSMLEVYMGNLKDLLVPKPSTRAYEAVSRCNLNIQTDSKGSVEIEGLTNVPVSDFKEASWWYTKGRQARSTSRTSVNEASSRSHCLMRITISRHDNALKDKLEVSKLWMVDLGGSERLLKTGATGQILDEGRAINLSLSALGHVIAALKRKQGHVPYRNSKLTQILRDSLGAISKVMMLVHISPCEEDVRETICSLAFAKRARALESFKDLPEELKRQRERRISELEEEMRVAEEECHKIKNQREKVEFLLSQNKKLYRTTHQVVEDEKETRTSPRGDLVEVVGTPKASKQALRRTISNSLPRFMNSTIASRQRQGTAERDVVNRAKCSDIDTKSESIPRNKMVTSSNPNLRGTVGRHKRRMSALI